MKKPRPAPRASERIVVCDSGYFDTLLAIPLWSCRSVFARYSDEMNAMQIPHDRAKRFL